MLRHLGRLAEAPERNIAHELIAGDIRPAGLREDVVHHRSFQKRRMHRVAAHQQLEARAMERHRLRQQPHAALGRIVGRKIMAADDAGDRRQIDDRAAAAFEQRQRLLAAEKGAVEVDRQHAAPGGVIGILDAAEQRDARGIDEPVETPVRAIELGQYVLPVGLHGDIETMIDADVAHDVGRDRDAALARHRRGHGATDGPGRPGDAGSLSAPRTAPAA